MEIQQETKTVLVAAEGKLLRRKSDGHIFGQTVHLGYDYYEAGVALSQPRLLTPDDLEEIDIPEGYEERPVIDHVKRLQRTTELMAKNVQEINSLGLTAEQSLAVKNWFPVWGVDIKEGDNVAKGLRFQFTPEGEEEARLYEVLQDHTVLSHYYPSVNTASLYMEVVEETDETGAETGTLENPIAYDGNMILYAGKYYTQGGVLYLCNRDSGNAVYHNLSELVGLYVETV